MEVTFAQSKKPEPPKPVDQKPPEPKPEVKIPTPEELKQQTVDLYATMGWGKPPEKPAEAPAAAPAPAGDAPAAPAEPPAAPAAPAPEPEPEPEPEPLSTAELITQSAQATAREVAKALKPEEPAPAPPAEPKVEMTPEDERDLQVVRYLERSDPKQYSGLEQRYVAYVKAHYARLVQWQTDHPDQEYDPNSEENQAWYDANMPDELTEDVVEQAKIDMAAEAKVQERIRPIEEERAKEKQEKALADAGDTIVEQLDRKVLALVELVDPELAKLVKDDKGKPALTPENVAKLEDANPIAKEVLDEVVRDQLEPLLFELEKTTVPGLGYKLDPRGNAAHAAIASFLAKKERDMASAPRSAQLDPQGRRWISLADYSREVNAIQTDGRLSSSQKDSQIAAMDRQVWTISADQLEDLMCDFYAKKAKAIIEKRETVARKRFKVAGEPAGSAPAAPASAPPVKPQPAAGKPQSPSLGGQSEVVTSSHLSQGSAKSFPKQAVDVLFSR